MEKKQQIPGYTFVRYKAGFAYYLATDAEFVRVRKHIGSPLINIMHALSGNMYEAPLGSLEPVDWRDIPSNYQLDMIARRPQVREHFGSNSSIPNSSNMNLEQKLIRAVDAQTGLLRTVRIPTRGDFYAEIDLPDDSHSKQQFNQKKTTGMSLLNGIPGLDLNFGKVEAGRIAISMNGDLAFRNKDGYVTVTVGEDGTKKQVSVGDLKFDVDFYKVPTQELEVGDLVELDREFFYVDSKKDGSIQFINPVTGARTNKLERTNILNMYFYTKIVSLFDMANGGQKGVGLGGLDPMTLMLLTGKDGLGKGGDLTEMLILSQLMGGAQGNPMMMLLLSKSASTDSLLPLMLMSQGGFGGKAGANPFGNLFGGKPAVKAAPKKATKYLVQPVADTAPVASTKVAEPAAKKKVKPSPKKKK